MCKIDAPICSNVRYPRCILCRPLRNAVNVKRSLVLCPIHVNVNDCSVFHIYPLRNISVRMISKKKHRPSFKNKWTASHVRARLSESNRILISMIESNRILLTMLDIQCHNVWAPSWINTCMPWGKPGHRVFFFSIMFPSFYCFLMNLHPIKCINRLLNLF